MNERRLHASGATAQDEMSGETVSVVVYPAARTGGLSGLLDSLHRLEGPALEVLLTPGVEEPDKTFAPFVKRVVPPFRADGLSGVWVLELREDWRPADAAWLTRAIPALSVEPQAQTGCGAVRPAGWFLPARKDTAAPPYAHYLLWRAAAFLRLDAARPALALPQDEQNACIELAEAPLAWRGAEAGPCEGVQVEEGLRSLLLRARRRLSQATLRECGALLTRAFGANTPTTPAPTACPPDATKAVLPTPTAHAGFLAFPRKPVAAAGRFAILSQRLPPSPDSGGIGRYSDELATRLVELGAEIHLITQGQGEPTLETMGLYRHPVQPPQRPRRFEPLPIAERNIQLGVAAYQRVVELELGGLRFDALEAPNWDAEGFVLSLAPAPPLAVRVHTPRVVSIRIEGWAKTPDQERNIGFESESILHADGLSASTRGITKTIGEIMGPSRSEGLHFTHIPLGIKPGQAPTPAAPHEDLRILFVGRLEARKGIRALLEALPVVLHDCPQAAIDIVGDDTLPEASGHTWKDGFLARHAGASWLTRCRFRGKISEERLSAFYRDCDLFVAPSLYESFGLIYLEAMREGKAVIGCPVGGVPEVVEDGVNGLLVAPDDGAALAKAMIRLLNDRDEREAMGQAGRRCLEERFDVQQTAVKTLAFYRRLAEGRRFEAQGRLLVPYQANDCVRGGSVVYDEAGSPAWQFDAAQPLHLDAPKGWTRFTFRSGPDGGRLIIRPPYGRARRLDLCAAEVGCRVAFFEQNEQDETRSFELRTLDGKTARLLSVLTTPAIVWPGQLSWNEAEQW